MSTPTEYLAKCKKVPIIEATKPRDGLTMIYADCWWTVIDECILYHGHGSPQCNGSEEFARRIKDKLCPDADVRHIAFVFQPTRPRDWCD